MKRLLRYLGLAPYSEVRRLSATLLALDDAYKDLEETLWKRYMNRLKNDVHMSLSWFYTAHVQNVSLGIPETQAQSTWPYYPKAQLLEGKPVLVPEKL